MENTEYEFVAQLEKSAQITEDCWVVTKPTLALTEKTTMEQIYRWYRRHCPQGFMEITINQLEK